MRRLLFILHFLFISLFVMVSGIGVYLFITDRPDIITAFSSLEEQMRNIPINVWLRIYHSQLSNLLMLFFISYFAVIMLIYKINWRMMLLGSLLTILLITEQMAGYYFPFSNIVNNAGPEIISNMPMSRLRIMASLGNLPWQQIHTIILPIILAIMIPLIFLKTKGLKERNNDLPY